MHNVELGLYGFAVVDDAAWVSAFQDALNRLGQLNLEFLEYNIVFDEVD
jgi:hypothetical protein